jgi:hypothetical protein
MNSEAKAEMDANKDWAASVSVVGRNTVVTTIESAAAALIFMDKEWPGARGARFAKARRAVSSAVAGLLDVTEARSAFLIACSEADCIIRTDGC